MSTLPLNRPHTLTCIVRSVNKAPSGKGSKLIVDYAVEWSGDKINETFQEFYLRDFYDKIARKLEPGMAITIDYNLTGRIYDNPDPAKGKQMFSDKDVRMIEILDGQQVDKPATQCVSAGTPTNSAPSDGLDW